ncbi:MAG: hypothetical protein NT169_15690 [Chloroflexi bacterium]|nr:hypothetical protein [Chloroflexota bacterium]
MILCTLATFDRALWTAGGCAGLAVYPVDLPAHVGSVEGVFDVAMMWDKVG